MPVALNDIERKILDYMVRYLRANTFQPSIREIGEEFGIKSTKTVSEYLGGLAEKGYVQRDPSRSRGVRLLGVDLSPQTVSIPCYPELPDSEKGFSADGLEAYLSVDRRMSGAKGSHFVRVRGDRFAAVGLEEGDLLLIEPTGARSLSDGDLAVIRHEGHAELFRVHRSDEGVVLRSSRTGMEVLRADRVEDLDVTGRVVGLFRRLDGQAVVTSPTAH